MIKERPSFQKIYMGPAYSLSERSTCGRLSVGAVITSQDYRQVYGIGYNGGASGLKNDCDSHEPGQCGHLHAELNACLNSQARRSDPKIVFVTHLPCKMCARALVNLGGVEFVYYSEEYRSEDSKEIFKQAGIPLIHFPAI